MKMPRPFTLFVCAIATLAAACGSPQGEPIRVTVPRGASFATAADSLDRAGLVKPKSLFRFYARLKGQDRSIKPGTYLFRPGTPWGEIVAALHGGHGLVNTMTVPEGFTLAQISALLAQTLSVPLDSVNAAVNDTALLSRLEIPIRSPEGYLFPDTYAFPDGTDARTAVLEMVRRFEREWQPAWDSLLPALGRTRHEIMTIASIVEREARIASEMPVIASVYYNRLRIGMPLQADPTVQYARGQHVARLLHRDLDVDSPYNTYRYPGLPPGPIASPGGASIRAALDPAGTDFLYFVAAPDGHHEFRRTLAEHQQAIRSVRSAARK